MDGWSTRQVNVFMAFAGILALVATVLVVQWHEPLIFVGVLALILGSLLLPIWKRF